jgi:hypothetical protein
MRFGTYSLVALCTLAAAACGGGGGGDDVGDDTPPEGTHYKYVADSVLVPTSTTEVQTYGSNVDKNEVDDDGDGPDEKGDDGIDNQLGSVLAALTNFNFDVQGNVTTSVDTGSIILLADYQTLDFASAAHSGLQLKLGANPTPAACTDASDTVCRHHLTGTATFTIDPMSPTDAIVTGAVANGVFTSKPGNLTLQIALSAGNPIPLNLKAARAELRMTSATGIMDGKLSGAIAASDINNNILPAVKGQLDAIVAEDCPTAAPPDCACTPSTTGEMLLSMFDENADCEITVMELQTNPIISGFLTPDVRLTSDTDPSITAPLDALSIGVKFTAVGAMFP